MGRYSKSAIIGIVIFFGSGFSIMAFHNDIGIVDLFAQIYEQVIGYAPQRMGGLEIGYSIGLALGILVFFNHISLKKRENDPTPLQVEVSKYEQDVEDTIQRIRQKESGEVTVQDRSKQSCKGRHSVPVSDKTDIHRMSGTREKMIQECENQKTGTRGPGT